MTLGEKLKEARKQAGLSQEQFAKKMNISRSAIAKWESDRGIPDIDNLKVISQLLNISIDYLLDETEDINQFIFKEKIDLSKYEGKKHDKKSQIICEHFPNDKIYQLLGEEKLSKGEKILDNAIGFLTSAPFGIPEFINSLKHMDKEFYLVDRDERQFLVIISDEFIESYRIDEKITQKKFDIGDWHFINCGLIKH